MTKQRLILLGGGGHCKSCIEVIESTERFKIEGIVDIKEKIGLNVLGYKVIASDNDIADLIGKDTCFLVTVGQIKSADLRKDLYIKLKKKGARISSVISPFAKVSKHSQIGEGTIVMHGVKINADAVIGENCIINTNANIEHDCTIGSHVHVSTSAVLNGCCVVGDESFIGSNSVLLNGADIGFSVIIGAGSVVTKSILDTGVYIGSPCHKIS